MTEEGQNKPSATILVAEDEPAISKLLSEFARKRGFQVVNAFDGEQTLAVVREQKPDVILLDVQMPKMDGRDVMVKLKEEDLIANTVVIFVTARDEQWDRVTGLELGADDYETKPINLVTLFAKIDRLMTKKKNA